MVGKRSRQRQDDLFITHEQLAVGGGHPFYEALGIVLRDAEFDNFVEELCATYYHGSLGRPSLAPGIYFRCLLIGYFEGIGSERGVAWRVADSLSLRQFLGLALQQSPPDHSTLSRTRRRLPVEAHEKVFQWMIALLASKELIKGKTVGIDSTTLEANAALRSIVRRDSGQSYQDFLGELARNSGIATPTHADLAKLDRHRKDKGKNDQWQHPQDSDAKITKMKDGRIHLAHKLDHAVDFDSGALLAVTVQDANLGDTQGWQETIEQACENLQQARQCEAAAEHLPEQVVEEVVADKGFHSNQVLVDLEAKGIRSYLSEPDRGRRNWEGKPEARRAVYGNRRRVRGERGKRLLRQRGELLERSFAHELETGGLRRVHVRGQENVLKRMLIQASGFNFGLLMRHLAGVGKPRCLQGAGHKLLSALRRLVARWQLRNGPPQRYWQALQAMLRPKDESWLPDAVMQRSLAMLITPARQAA